MPATPQSRARTRALARVIGPLLVVVPSIVAARAWEMDALVAAFFENGVLVCITGIVLLCAGLLIIVYHQYWSSPSAVFISLFGWLVVLRGGLLVIAPQLMAHGDGGAMIAFPVVRLGFGLLFLVGIWLTFAGWTTEPEAPAANDL